MSMLSVGIDLKELGGRLPKCLKFCQGLKFKADFHPKMSVCRHELGGGGFNTQPPDNCNPVDADSFDIQEASRCTEWGTQYIHLQKNQNHLLKGVIVSPSTS